HLVHLGTSPVYHFHHLVLRRSSLTGEIMLIIVSASDGFPGDKEAAEKVRELFPAVTSVILNVNPDDKGPVLGLRNRILSGAGFIRDQICGVPVEIGPLSFFQVNISAAEALYKTAAEFAEVRGEDVVLDLYCGMGTIGLSMAANCRQLIGGEIVPEAVESAKRNAAVMGLNNTRFFCGDAAEIAETLIREHIHPTLIILDPPRKGCSPETLAAVKTLDPDRIVMVSCDPATAARDCKTLFDAGYHPSRLRPADLFPRTRHVETVCFLYHQKKDFFSVPYESKNGDYLQQRK
ncbi:MAG: 23S rRNA (uracil(1939)-C(5))-methyltransferase RlmD, partial [Anaerolineaceae bacterium]|nr:23S rRNA (uracil(1939)-C(5))-methyltransferase RlmD [Anaerolineaceae bacterium]